jgi:hypothetical protein
MGIMAALCGISEVNGECERLFAITALGVGAWREREGHISMLSYHFRLNRSGVAVHCFGHTPRVYSALISEGMAGDQ